MGYYPSGETADTMHYPVLGYDFYFHNSTVGTKLVVFELMLSEDFIFCDTPQPSCSQLVLTGLEECLPRTKSIIATSKRAVFLFCRETMNYGTTSCLISPRSNTSLGLQVDEVELRASLDHAALFPLFG